MKRFIIFGRLYTLLFFAVPVQVTAQDPDPFPNYVVRGASAAYHKTIIRGNVANSHPVVEGGRQPDMSLASAIMDKASVNVEDIEFKVSEAPCPGECRSPNRNRIGTIKIES